MQTECGGARSRHQDFAYRKLAESGRFWTDISRWLPFLMENNLSFVLFEHTINRLSFIYVCLPQPEYYFFSFFLLFFLFFFLLRLSTFKPLNAVYSKFEQLKISGRIRVGLKSGVPGWGDPLQSVSQKFWNFKPLQTRWIKFSKWVNIKNKLNLTKIGESTMDGFPPKQALQNLNFLIFKARHMYC